MGKSAEKAGPVIPVLVPTARGLTKHACDIVSDKHMQQNTAMKVIPSSCNGIITSDFGEWLVCFVCKCMYTHVYACIPNLLLVTIYSASRNPSTKTRPDANLKLCLDASGGLIFSTQMNADECRRTQMNANTRKHTHTCRHTQADIHKHSRRMQTNSNILQIQSPGSDSSISINHTPLSHTIGGTFLKYLYHSCPKTYQVA